jgi:exonuclease SbcC|tara:strand:+ start:1498 stop:3543 length:2046 start_codon:yes stop_codon:yes gene_type:complete
MKLKKIILNNIRSYENQEILFSEGSTLLSGDIGSGKTSILLGIEFALFGLQPGQRGSSLLRNGKDSGGVIMEFEIDGKEIVIERTLKRKKTVSQDYCSIIIDEEKKEISVMELKYIVLDLLNYPKEFSKKQNILYKFTVYTPQEEMKQIILQDSETRINTLRHIFGIDKYKKILENTSLLASKIREEKRLKEAIILNFDEDKINLLTKQNKLEEKNHNLVSVEKEFFLRTEKREEIQKEKEKISGKIEEKIKIQQEIEKTKLMISNKKEFILSNLKAIELLEIQIKEIHDLKFDDSEILKFENELILKKKEKEKINEDVFEISAKINSLNIKNNENEDIKNRINHIETCPTCLQEIDPSYKNNIFIKIESENSENLKKIEIFNLEKQNSSENLKKIENEIYLIEKRIQELNILKIKFQGIKEKQTQKQVIENSNSSLTHEIETLNLLIENLNNSLIELTKFDEIFEDIQKSLEESLKQERFAEIKVVELKKEIQFFLRQIEELKEKVKKVEEIKKQLFYLTDLENWLSQKFMILISAIEKNIMLKLKSEFSKLFVEWFSMLVSESFDVMINEDFTPILKQQDYEIDYSYLSGGERTAVALAYRLALNQVINSVLSDIKTKDIVVLDEPTDGFSEQQLDKMLDVLLQLDVNQLIIVSHEQKIEGFVENVIKFKKENNISVVE